MTGTLSQISPSISLPPISTINFDHQNSMMANTITHDMSHHSIPPPARTLPPLPYYTPMHAMPQPEYVQPARHMYPGQPYQMMPMGRMPLPSSAEAAAMIGYAPSRHTPKAKEVKRRTKTGCMTCRKRRIKVRLPGLPISFFFET